ncbi:TPA: aspartate aminotransferase family protein [archaeon]|nr:aspartate aminotransferase family protein [Candidatus Naiadarchaeales archaeon SRR2090153.bin461]
MPRAPSIVRESLKVRVQSGFKNPLVVRDGEGCYIKDVDNKKYLDFHSIVCTNNVGYGRPELKEVVRQYSKRGVYKIDGTFFYTEEALILAKKVLKTLPHSLKKVFFINSGAEAVENAIKLVYSKKGPYTGVCMENAFHGRTLGALTFTNSKSIHKRNFPMFPHHELQFCGEKDYCRYKELEDLIVREVTPAFVIMECVQGEGGYRPASKAFVQYLRKITKEHDIAFIIDEIQSGMGRTGKWWSFEHYNVVPDIMTAAKSLQVGATITSAQYDVNKEEIGSISSTWGGGHLIDLAMGSAVMDIIQKENLVKNAERMGKYMLNRFKEIQMKYPGKIIDARGLGLMIGVEMDNKHRQQKIIDAAFKGKLLLLGASEKTIRIAPPMVIDEATADKGIEILEKLIKKY